MPRYLTIIHHDEQNPPAEDPSPDLQKRMAELFEEITKAGVMLDTAELASTSGATRISWTGGRASYTDGPFTETREVVGGYSIAQCKDRAEALEWAKRFGEIQGQHEDLTIEVREIIDG